MHTGILILLSIAMAIAPSATVLACEGSAAHSVGVADSDGCCCCDAETTGDTCVSCTPDAGQAGTSPDESGAHQDCHCGQTTPLNHKAPQTESVSAEIRLAIWVLAARHELFQQGRIEHVPVAPRRDPHPDVRCPLLL